MSGRPVRLVLAVALLFALGTMAAGCRKAEAPERSPAAVTATASPSPATSAPTDTEAGPALTASDAAAIEKELSAIEKELGALSLPSDDFSSAEKALY